MRPDGTQTLPATAQSDRLVGPDYEIGRDMFSLELVIGLSRNVAESEMRSRSRIHVCTRSNQTYLKFSDILSIPCG